jgi:hypothetical protein
MDETPQSYYWRNREAILAKTKERYYARTPEECDADRIKNAATKRRSRGKPLLRKPGPIVFAIVSNGVINPFE